MHTRIRSNDLADLRERILRSIRDVAGKDVEVEVDWLEDSPQAEEVLVQVILSDPGENKTWDQNTTNAIRTAVREATAALFPSVVATTRLVSSNEDG